LIYFICHPDAKNYQWDVVPLAEGLEELGVPLYGSADYWKKPDGSWLIKRREGGVGQQADAVVVSTGFLFWNQGRGRDQHGQLPGWIVQRELQGKVVGMDFCDGYLSPVMQKWSGSFDIILRTHFNRRCDWPQQTRPWAYGLTNRILAAATKCRNEKSPKKGCLFAFGASHGYLHGAREHARKHLFTKISSRLSMVIQQDKLSEPPADPEERRMWFQCAGRHNPEYFRRLSAVQVCAAFCGEFVPSLPLRPNFLVGGNRAKMRRLFWTAISRLQGCSDRLIQADSWRFWEALACGAAVLHHDADETGWTLPVPPIPFETYLPVSLRGDNQRLMSILSDEQALREIAENGQNWAFENYSPKKVAERFLEEIKK
jgi:hypothetical protein